MRIRTSGLSCRCNDDAGDLSSQTVVLHVRQCQARTCVPALGFGQCATMTFGYRSSCPLGHRSGGISVTLPSEFVRKLHP